jgi:hypothetical protein
VLSFFYRYGYCYNKYGTLRFDGADAALAKKSLQI